jgi:hypothetical protein
VCGPHRLAAIAALAVDSISASVNNYPVSPFDYVFTARLHRHIVQRLLKVKVKVTLEQAMKAQRGSRGIALLFL